MIIMCTECSFIIVSSFFVNCLLQNIEPEQSGQIPDPVGNVIKGKHLMASQRSIKVPVKVIIPDIDLGAAAVKSFSLYRFPFLNGDIPGFV